MTDLFTLAGLHVDSVTSFFIGQRDSDRSIKSVLIGNFDASQSLGNVYIITIWSHIDKNNVLFLYAFCHDRNYFCN